ncbi:hypothetical protein [Fibrella arboris]|uniref:hypothetical protein n=1 Tax=Fibrella arboris TaxID=3242486 RepID=UPI00352308C5
MKTLCFLLLLAGPFAARAQKPLSATLTNPKSVTLQVPKNPKLPVLNLPCKMANGVDDRPFACEFRLDRLEFLGKDGSLLGTVKRTNAHVSLPLNQAKKTPAGQITYAVKAYLTRINKPSFPVNKGYLIQSCAGVACTAAQYSDMITQLTGLQIPATLGKQTVVPFDLTWAYSKGNESLFQMYLENDVTANMLTPKPGTVLAMSDKAEASMIVAPTVK